MELKILQQSKNELFNREEIRFEATHEGEATPKLIDVKRVLANKTGVDSSHIIIDGFKTLYGIGRTIGDARVYKDMDELKDYEPEYLLKRNGVVGEPKNEEKPTESTEIKEEETSSEKEAPEVKEEPVEKKEEKEE